MRPPAPESLALLARLPEGGAEEHQAAEIDPRDVPELIGASGVDRRIDGDILPEQQAGQGNGHEGAVQHAQAEAREAVEIRRRKYFQSSAGFLKKGEGGRRKGEGK